MKKILLFICLFAYLTNSFSQNFDKRQEKVQITEKEISKFIDANFLGIKLTQNEIKKIRSEDEHEEHLSIQDIENMQIALERDRLRLLFFKKYPDKKAVYLASTYSKNTKQTGCVNGDFENGTTGYNFLSATNWNHPGGFNVNFGNTIGAPFGPFTPAHVAITNTGNNDPFIGVISEVFNGNHSLRLNPNAQNSTENATVMTRNFNINQPVLSLNFAFILETSHDDPIIDSFVRFEVYDTVLNQIVDSRVITAGDAAFNITNPWRWADWSCINLNVAESIGHDAILRVYVSDCAYTYHDSILYLDDICNNGVPCTNVTFGEIVLDPQGFDCPVDPFQVCGTFIAPSNAVTTTIELEILDTNNNIVITLTNPVINTNAGTFCFTVDPSIFGANPTGNYEFNATAQFTLNNGGITTDFDLSSVIGPDVTFDDCCNIDASPQFTMKTECKNGNFCVTATASDLTAGNHGWSLHEMIVEGGGTSDSNTVSPTAQNQAGGTSATFCWLNLSKTYYIKHGIWDDCYNWREVRIPVEKFDAEAIFNLETADGTVKDVFCYGEDVYLDGTASYGENRYNIHFRRRTKGSTDNFSWFTGLGWTLDTEVGVVNLTAALANLNPPREFELEYEYKVYLAIMNAPNCIGWTIVEHTFTIECCDDFFNADFTGRIADDGIIDVYNFDLYDNVNAVHEWYVLSSPNHNAGPYTPVYSGTSTGAYTANNSLELITNAQSGLHYTVIHKVITDCGEVCESDELHFDKSQKNEAQEKVDACCLAFEFWPDGPGTPPTTFTAEFDGDINSNGTLFAESFETYTNANAIHEWYVYSSPNPNGPYTLVIMVTSTTQTTVDLLSNAQSGTFYTIIHKVITDCLTECLDKAFWYKDGLLSEAPSSSKEGNSLPDPCCIADAVVITANDIDITDTKTYTIPCGKRGVAIHATNLEDVQYTSPDPVLFGGGNFGVPDNYQGSSFRVYITGTDSCGNSYRERLLIKIEPCCDLPAPTNVHLQRGRYLFWDSVPGAVSYIVSPSLEWDRTCTCRNPVSLRPIETRNNYTLLPFSEGTCYMVRVAAVCANGAISDYSEDICIGGDIVIDGGGVIVTVGKQIREVSITPNPTKGEMTFNVTTNADAEVTIAVYDTYGTLIKTFVQQVTSDDTSSISWDGSSLRKGIYFVNFKTKEETIYKQVIVK